MTLDQLIAFCEKFPGSEPIMKIDHHLTYNVGGKSFIWFSQDLDPISCDFKCDEDDFHQLSDREGFGTAPYIGRYGWIRCEDIALINLEDAERYIRRSYQIIFAGLPKKQRDKISGQQNT